MVYLDVTVAKLLILRSILKHTGLTHRSVVVFRRLTGLVLLQVVANIPTVVVEKPRWAVGLRTAHTPPGRSGSKETSQPSYPATVVLG
jgi:hypothetical protein